MSYPMKAVLAASLLTFAAVAPCFGQVPPPPGQAAPPSAKARMMVVAANPLAARAGMEVLRHGGTAIDAAVAVQAVLGLVEPQSSGVAGGALIVTYTAKTGKVAYYDGRETAPAAAGPDLFLHPDGTPMSFYEAMLGGRSVGVPGAIAALELAHQDQGRTKWADLFAPAIALAEAGFAVTPHMVEEVDYEKERLQRQPALRDYLHVGNGGMLTAGTVLKNPAYADTLRRIAASGAAGLLRGRIAEDIALTVRQDPNHGMMTTDDLAAYKAVRREPVCGPYHAYRICAASSPTAGGTILLQTLGMLQDQGFDHVPATGAEADMLIIEAERLAMADRDAFGGDVDFVHVPFAGLIDPAYIAARAKLIDRNHAAQTVSAGHPAGEPVPAAQKPQPEHGTSDVAIVDGEGNAVSMTTTIEDIFGSHLMVDGFVLNNELTDFSLMPDDDGKVLANRVQGGKRPRSSMAPAVVLDQNGHLVAVVGSAGGMRIPGFVIQATIGALDWHMTPAQALAQGHVGSVGRRNELEAGTPAAQLAGALEQRGEKIGVDPMPSGSSMIVVTPQGLTGAADPRRDGVALGE
jgi:gamma-glutamyltranspeptidase/glutathione hydrolase